MLIIENLEIDNFTSKYHKNVHKMKIYYSSLNHCKQIKYETTDLSIGIQQAVILDIRNVKRATAEYDFEAIA